jgi:hypothetical protein
MVLGEQFLLSPLSVPVFSHSQDPLRTSRQFASGNYFF